MAGAVCGIVLLVENIEADLAMTKVFGVRLPYHRDARGLAAFAACLRTPRFCVPGGENAKIEAATLLLRPFRGNRLTKTALSSSMVGVKGNG